MLPDPGMVDFAWEVVGYLLMNGNPLHRAFLLVGAGRNGKSTFLRLVEHLLGRADCSSVPLQKLGDGHRFASAEMFMKSANVCGDLAATHLKDTSTFKQVTGGDPVFAERKIRDPFEFIYWGVPDLQRQRHPRRRGHLPRVPVADGRSSGSPSTSPATPTPAPRSDCSPRPRARWCGPSARCGT